MKLLVLSDTHRFLGNAKNIIEKIGSKIDVIIHLGDHDNDAETLSIQYPNIKFYWVRGNNDFGKDTPFEFLLKVKGKKLLLTHGHRQQVHWNYGAISYFAEEQEADMVLFGHTHVPLNDRGGRVMLFNPGSISLPRSTKNPTFGIVTINDNGLIEASIMEYSSKNEFKIIG